MLPSDLYLHPSGLAMLGLYSQSFGILNAVESTVALSNHYIEGLISFVLYITFLPEPPLVPCIFGYERCNCISALMHC